MGHVPAKISENEMKFPTLSPKKIRLRRPFSTGNKTKSFFGPSNI